jgi:hypothetical protein
MCFGLEGDCLAKGTRHLRRSEVFRPFDVEFGLFPFDHPRIDSLPARQQLRCRNIPQQSLVAPWHLVVHNHLEFRDRILYHTHGMGKAEAVGVDLRLHGGLVHEETDGIVSDQQPI